MNSTEKSHGFFRNLLRRTGGRYLLIVIAMAQLLSFPAAALGVVAIQVNAQFAPEQLRPAILIEFVLLVVGGMILLAISYFFCRDAFTRLNKQIDRQDLPAGTSEELNAWKQITNISWRYGGSALIISALIFILPLLAYLSYSLGATRDQIYYTLFGSVASSLSIIVLAVLLIERMIIPAREMLIPASFESQIAGATSMHIFLKFQSIILALIIVAILLVAPLGYHLAYTILFQDIGTVDVFLQLRTLSLIASGLALTLGFGLSLLLSGSVSTPINQLMDVFQRVKQGDMGQRARIIATDEIGSLAVYFNQMVAQLEQFQRSLEELVAERTKELEVASIKMAKRAEQLTTVADVAQAIASVQDVNTLLDSVAKLISDRFNFYHTGIFLLNENNEFAVLKAASSVGGKKMLERKHKLKVGEEGIVGAVTGSGSPRVALDTGADAAYIRHPDLPKTRSELTLPLKVGERIIGALDVQSELPNAFTEDDIKVLGTLANQVAIAIQNSNLFAETRNALNEAQAAYQKFIQAGWIRAMEQADQVGYQFSSNIVNQLKTPLSRPEIDAVLETGKALTDAVVDNNTIIPTLAVPIKVRGETIGVLDIRAIHPDRQWEKSDLATVQTVADRLAFALENARLIHESQKRAARERAIADMTSKIGSSVDVNTILQQTVQELGKLIGNSEVTIQIGNEIDSHHKE